jgi:hypothetical protein
MSKGAYRFKETEVARICRAALKAGANKVRYTKEGHFEIEFGPPTTPDTSTNVDNEWDEVLPDGVTATKVR